MNTEILYTPDYYFRVETMTKFSTILMTQLRIVHPTPLIIILRQKQKTQYSPNDPT